MNPATILTADDATFREAWTKMTMEMRAALPDDVRAKCVSRYRRMTPYIDASITRLERVPAQGNRHTATPDASDKESRIGEGRATSESIDGAALLQNVFDHLGRFVAYPSFEAQVAHALWIAHTHLMDIWESTPRIAFLSPEPGSGKTRALEITENLVPRPVAAVNTTPAYLFRKVSDPDGLPTILHDEIDTVFGPRARGNEEVRAILNAGHRRGATAGRCVMRGKVIETEELSAYCAVALAGLGDLPDTILTRSVVITMRRRSPVEVVEPYRQREHALEGNALRDRLAAWATAIKENISVSPDMPEGITDRDADVWESLLAIADAAGGEWPTKARVTAVTLVTAAKAATPSLGVRLLSDLRQVFGDRDAMPTNEIVQQLVALEESPWTDLQGKALDGRRLGNLLRRYGVASKTVRVNGQVVRGYTRADLHDPWTRYATKPNSEDMAKHGSRELKEFGLEEPAMESVTSVTSVTVDAELF